MNTEIEHCKNMGSWSKQAISKQVQGDTIINTKVSNEVSLQQYNCKLLCTRQGCYHNRPQSFIVSKTALPVWSDIQSNMSPIKLHAKWAVQHTFTYTSWFNFAVSIEPWPATIHFDLEKPRQQLIAALEVETTAKYYVLLPTVQAHGNYHLANIWPCWIC